MKKLRSHFWYTQNQRSGIFLLLILIVLVQGLIYFVDFKGESHLILASKEVKEIQNRIDSLKNFHKKETYKLRPFNPNYITDYKGYQLGLSVEELDKLYQYRKAGKFVNSVNEFKQVTNVSDSLLKEISPYFKFPDWVIRKQLKSVKRKVVKEHLKKIDLNKATQQEFEVIVNESLAKRIVKYRDKIKGFFFKDQLQEVWGISSEDYELIKKSFIIIEKPQIEKININTASFKEVLSLPYIDYDLCKKIFDYRDEVAEIQSISELKNIDGFPIKKYDRIVLYLLAN